MRAANLLNERPRPLIMAHRGNSAKCPENTLAAFRQAIADGADIIETDVHVSADDVLMCIHDATVDRTTNGQGAVAQLTCAELQHLSASYGQNEFEREIIPTLEQLLEILPESVALALELKSDDFLEEHVCHQLRDLLQRTNALDRTVILSFSRERLRAVDRYAPELPTGLISMTNLLPEKGWSMTGSFWPMMFINPLYTWLAHKSGQVVCPLDPVPDSRLWFYRLTNCDAVLTNDPAQTARALGRSS